MNGYLIKSELADYTGLTRQRVSKLHLDGKLPDPDERTHTGDLLWLPATIDRWMSETGRIKSGAAGPGE